VRHLRCQGKAYAHAHRTYRPFLRALLPGLRILKNRKETRRRAKRLSRFPFEDWQLRSQRDRDGGRLIHNRNRVGASTLLRFALT
jgi:hypothetical protein